MTHGIRVKEVYKVNRILQCVLLAALLMGRPLKGINKDECHLAALVDGFTYPFAFRRAAIDLLYWWNGLKAPSSKKTTRLRYHLPRVAWWGAFTILMPSPYYGFSTFSVETSDFDEVEEEAIIVIVHGMEPGVGAEIVYERLRRINPTAQVLVLKPNSHAQFELELEQIAKKRGRPVDQIELISQGTPGWIFFNDGGVPVDELYRSLDEKTISPTGRTRIWACAVSNGQSAKEKLQTLKNGWHPHGKLATLNADGVADSSFITWDHPLYKISNFVQQRSPWILFIRHVNSHGRTRHQIYEDPFLFGSQTYRLE